MTPFEVELSGLPPMNSADGMHWRTRHRLKTMWLRRVDHAILETLGRRPAEPLERARVTITRRSSVEPDADNLAQGAKFLLDGLVRSRVLADDSPAHLEVRFEWVRSRPRSGSVRIRVEPLELGPLRPGS